MDKKDNLIKDSFILFIASSIVNISNFVFHMIATRNLKPEDYGILATLLGIIMVISMPCAALQMSIVKKTSILKAKNLVAGISNLFREMSKWLIIIGFSVFLIFIIFADIIRSFFNINDKRLIYILGFVILIYFMLPVVRGILQGLQKFIGYGINMITDAIFRLLFLILFIYFGFGVYGALSTTFFSGVCAYIIGIFMIIKIIRYKSKEMEKIMFFKDIIGYALPVLFSFFAFSLLGYIDLFMVKHFYPEDKAGLYAVTSIIGKAFLFFPSAVVMVLFPKVSEHYELKINPKKMLYKSLFLTALLSFIGIIFCYFFPEFVLWLLTGGGKYYAIKEIVKIFGIAILPLVLLNVIINYNLAIHNYTFIFIVYLGIILYAVILWFFHSTFYTVLSVLFIMNLLILIFSIITIELNQRKVKLNEI
ncbi:MAG: oligosaccharide flippase family protein [Candidatus Goldbacteria bacterium]|nr:oligosaccharide flippase family protein [Candidatus Goldiibacteriota bacterium]